MANQFQLSTITSVNVPSVCSSLDGTPLWATTTNLISSESPNSDQPALSGTIVAFVLVQKQTTVHSPSFEMMPAIGPSISRKPDFGGVGGPAGPGARAAGGAGGGGN